jgi:hypothetical protein
VVATETEECYREGIQAFTSRWHKIIDSEGDYVEK